MQEAPNANKCHPRIEHLIPLHVAFAAALGTTENTNRSNDSDDTSSKHNTNTMEIERIYSQIIIGNLSLDCYVFK